MILTEKDIHKGNLILVNGSFPVRDRENLPIAEAAPNAFLQKEAAYCLREAIKRVKGENEIVLVSGFRSRREQSEIYKMALSENGEAFTKRYVALPDHSEHQTGLAADLALKADSVDFIRPDFPFDGICGEFRRIAAEYGFILRYPKGKENVTGIAYEPWHFRYVGALHAKIMEKNGLTLEEYSDFIRSYGPERRLRAEEGAEIFYLEANGDLKEIKVTLCENKRVSVSGNNIDGFIVTIFK